MVAGPCPVLPSATSSVSTGAEGANRANSHPLHISIKTEADYAQVNNVQHSELRNSCVVLMHNSPNSAVTLALARRASAVEVHGSGAAVLDAAARYRATNANYLVGFSAAELQTPGSAPSPSATGKDEIAPGEWAAQRFGVYAPRGSSPSGNSGSRTSPFSGLPGTAELARRFDTSTSSDSRSNNGTDAQIKVGGVSASPAEDRQFNVLRGLSGEALRKMAGNSAQTQTLRWGDHPQWGSWPWYRSTGYDQDGRGADDSASQRQSSQEAEQSLLLYASPAVARATRTVSIASLLLLGCWSNASAVCKRVGEWWSEPSTPELLRRYDTSWLASPMTLRFQCCSRDHHHHYHQQQHRYHRHHHRVVAAMLLMLLAILTTVTASLVNV